MKELNYTEEDRVFTQMIRHWPEEKPLLKLCLTSCRMSQTAWMKLLQFLSRCKHLISLDLSGNFLGVAGHELAQSITSWGDEPPLQELYLYNCSLGATASFELVQSLSSCRHLAVLGLGGNKLGEAGHQLAQSIRSWGDEPPLQEPNLNNCSLTASATLELVQSLSTCRCLTVLYLRGNKSGEVGQQLAQSIRSLGDEPPLRKLDVGWCSVPEQVWAELLQSLSSCKQLSDLDLSDNSLRQAGHYLAQSITSWGDNPPLQKLNLGWCSIPEQVWAELLQSLSSCKQLAHLYLTYHTIGEAGRYLAQSITSWGDNPPLQKLDLCNCSIPKQVWAELLQSLSSCKQLTNLDLSGNRIGEAGRFLAQAITSWGHNPSLQELMLFGCSIPEQVMAELLQSLSSCKQLTDLILSGNTIDEAGRYLAQSIRSWEMNHHYRNLI